MGGLLEILRQNLIISITMVISILIILPRDIYDFLQRTVFPLDPRWVVLGYVEPVIGTVQEQKFESIYTLIAVDICVLLAGIALGSVLQYYFQDYATFFPAHVRFHVYFQERMLREKICEFSESQMRSAHLCLEDDWRSLRRHYMANRNEYIKEIEPSTRFVFDDDTSGEGYFSFSIRKLTHQAEAQSYQIELSSFGLVDFSSLDGGEKHVIMARFRVIDDAYHQFRVKLRDLIHFDGNGPKRFFSLRRYTITRPRMSQIAYRNLTEERQIGRIVALTRVQYFPVTKLSSTVYLVSAHEIRTMSQEGDDPSNEPSNREEESLTPMVPIAYGDYIFD